MAQPGTNQGAEIGGGAMFVLAWAWVVVCAVAGMPLQAVDLEVYAAGPMAELTLHQRFVNDGDEPVDAVYVFPLHEASAVDGMTLRVGDRVIEGLVLDREQAVVAFDEAVHAGKTAALTTQQRPNLFTQQVGNIGPGETVEVTIRALWPLPHEDDRWRLVLPLLAAPRFVRPDALAAMDDPTGALALDPVVDDAGAPLEARVELVIDSGLPMRSFDCPTHALAMASPSEARREASGRLAMDRDLACSWTTSGSRPEVAAWVQDDHLLLTLVPPADPPTSERVPRELIWVIDQSCSMDGRPMDLVKRAMSAALDDVDARDSLRILSFSDRNRGDPGARPATPQVLKESRLAVKQLDTHGGTWLLEGVLEALDTPPDPTRDRMILFLTDGLVDNENDVLAAIADRVGRARLFALGAGPAPNRWLLDEMARFGGGRTTWLREGEDPQQTVDRFVDSLGRVSLTELVIDWGDWEVEEVWPRRLPALHAGQPTHLTARVIRRGTTPIAVYGRLGDGDYARELQPRDLPAGRMIPSTWAREKIATLERDLVWGDVPDLREEIRSTSVAYQVLSRFTAFLAVDHRVRAEPRAEASPDRERHGREPLDTPERQGPGQSAGRTEPAAAPGEPPAPEPETVEASPSDQSVTYTEGDHGDIDIEVVARDQAVEEGDTSTGGTLGRAMLDRLPANRSYQETLNRIAGVNPGGANQSMGGAAANESVYKLDGVSITDPVTGTFSVNFNFDAIEQIEVLLGGYMPEHGNALGGVVNLTTQSGTNNLQFMTGAYYGNGNWRSRIDERITPDGLTLSPTGFDSEFELVQLSNRVSGPLLRDRAWFLISHQYDRSILSNTGIPQRRDYDAHYLLAKLAFQPAHEQRLTALIQLDPTTVDNIDQGNPYQKAEAQGRQAQGGVLGQLKWQWFPSENVQLETTVSSQKSYIELGGVPCTHHDRDVHPCEPGEREGSLDWETPGRLGVGGAFSSVNFPRYLFDDRYRHAVSSKLTLLSVDDPLGGRHDIKLGIEGNQLVWDQIQGFPGNLLFYDINEVPFDPTTLQSYYWLETTGPIRFRTTGSQMGAFVQDSWKPRLNLTVNYGARWDRQVLRNDLGEPVLAANLVSPRLYAAWDPWSDQRTKVAAGYGRFGDMGRLGVADWLSASGYGSHLYLGEFFAGSGFPTGVLNDAGNDYDTAPSDPNRTSHDRLSTPRIDEVILKLEREVVEDIALSSDLTVRFMRNQYEPDEQNLIFDSDGSTVIGARNGDPTQSALRLRTPALARRDYLRWDVGARKVKAHRWEASATYSYTQNRGTTPQALSGSFANDPQTRFNYGPLNTELTHAFKSWAWWDLPTDPWTQTVGLTLDAYSGAPVERLYTAENPGGGFAANTLRIRDRGTYLRLEPWWTLGVRFQQSIDVRKGRVVIDLQATNLLDNAATRGVDLGFLDSNNRLLISTRQDPRRYTAGLRYEF